MDKYRLITLIFGLTFTGISAGIGLLFPFSSNIAVLSFITALGSSTLFHALLGSLTEAEQAQLNLGADGQPLKDLIKLTGNIKIAGPMVSFLFIGPLMYYGLFVTQQNRDKSIDYTKTILNNIEISPTKGIVIDSDGNLYETLNLKYKNQQNQVFEREIELTKGRGSLIDTDFLQTKKLGIESKLDEKKIIFNVISLPLPNTLGFLDSKDLKEVLRKLAENTSEPNTDNPDNIPLGNPLTKSILIDCIQLTGVCKQPERYQIQLSFNTTNTLPEDRAYACPRGLILAKLKLIDSKKIQILIHRELDNLLKPVPIQKIIPFEDSSICQKHPDLVQINGKYSEILFPTGANMINPAYITITSQGDS